MSDSHDHAAHDAHEGPIKTPRQLIWTVVFAFVVPVVIIILLVSRRVAFSSSLIWSSVMLGPSRNRRARW